MMNKPIFVVKKNEDALHYAGETVFVEGVYQQQDVRMMQVNPTQLFKGHVAIELEDGSLVFLYAPAEDEAIRSKTEIETFENKKVRVKGVISPLIFQEGAVQQAPCLVNVVDIERI